DGVVGRQQPRFDLPGFGLASDFLHHGESGVCTIADHKLAAFPGYVFFNGKWRVAEQLAEFLGRLLLAFGDPPAIDQNVVFVAATVDFERAERKSVETHTRTP